jgi:hypothetical protein
MEQPVPTDRIIEARKELFWKLQGARSHMQATREAAEAFEVYDALIRAAAMADLQELREAAAVVLDDLPAKWEEFEEDMQATWDTAPTRAFYVHVQALRAALARLEGR